MKIYTAAIFFLGAINFCMAENMNIKAEHTNREEQMNCMAIDAATEKELHKLREGMLVPGAQINLEAIFATPELRKVRRAEEDRKSNDWAYLCRYKSENALLRKRRLEPEVVFIGDSITENWLQADSAYFGGANVNRGISGQTSSQVLLRFYADVVSLRPNVVHILIGTNDVAGNTGKIDDEDYQNNIRAMTDLAKTHGVRVVLGSIPPASGFPWRPDARPSERIILLNQWLKKFASESGQVYADYYAAMANADGGLDPKLGNDGVHPNRSGYVLMHEISKQAIARASAN